MGKSQRLAATIAGCAMLFGAVFGMRAIAATTYTVDNTVPCNDNGSGNASNPFCTIGKAAGVATAGDTVVVRAGTYSETVNPSNSGGTNTPITFRATGAVVVTGTTRGFLIRRNRIVVEGFEVRGTTSHGIYVNGGAFVTIRNNYVHDVGSPVDGQTAKGIYYKDAPDGTVEGNLVERATDAGIAIFGSSARAVVRNNVSNSNARGYARAATGIDVRSGVNVLIENNRVAGNEDSGINVWDSNNVIVRGNVADRNGDHGIDNKASTGTAIDGNTVFGGVDSGIEVVGVATGVTVTNNISADNGINSPRTTGNLRVDGTATNTVQLNYNLVWLSQPGDMVVWGSNRYATLAEFVSATGQMANGREGDPRFVSAGTGDFHLRAGSPAIDAANANAASHAPVDSEGNPRFDDPATTNSGAGVRPFDDMGAFEYQGGGVDQPPVAVNDAATMNEDADATALDVLANDTDPDGGPKSVAAVTQPANGTAVIVGGGSNVTYRPNANYCNTGGPDDTFTYSLAPGGSTATVSVTVTCVDDPPVAVNDGAIIDEDSATVTISVLANDTDVDGGPMSVASVTPPANGVAGVAAGGDAVTYRPNANYCNDGSTFDTFTYALTPGGATATVSVTVRCVDDPPVAVNDSTTVARGSSNAVIDVLANDTDIDGGPKAVASVTQPANGSAAVGAGGANVTYSPTPLYCSDSNPDTFTYTLTPGGSTATVSVTVSCTDFPPTAVDDAATLGEDDPPLLIDVLANDSDPDGGPMSVASVTQPAGGSVTIMGGVGVEYAPNANYCNDGGPVDTFTYSLAPGGSTATVSVTVTCVDDPPVAVNDADGVAQNSAPTTINVLANDTDVDGGTKQVASVTQPANGTVAITAAGAAVTYAPNAGYCNDGNPVETFTYTLTPGGSTATVSMTVSCSQPTLPIELLPSGDATIREAKPNSTNGSGVVLSVDGDPVKDILIKFDVTGIGQRSVARAVIRLWCVDSSGTGGKFHTMASSNWNENTVTWANAPAFDPNPFRSMGPVEAGFFAELDVTDIVRSDGSYSFRVDLISVYDAGYSSKEEPDTSKRPKLIITF